MCPWDSFQQVQLSGGHQSFVDWDGDGKGSWTFINICFVSKTSVDRLACFFFFFFMPWRSTKDVENNADSCFLSKVSLSKTQPPPAKDFITNLSVCSNARIYCVDDFQWQFCRLACDMKFNMARSFEEERQGLALWCCAERIRTGLRSVRASYLARQLTITLSWKHHRYHAIVQKVKYFSFSSSFSMNSTI